MPRQTIDLNSFKDQIQQWYLIDHVTTQALCDRVAEHDVFCSRRTMERKLSSWGFFQREHSRITPSIRLLIAILFQSSYNDALIVRFLQKEGIYITEWKVQEVRRGLGLLRRMSVNQRQQAHDQLVEIVQAELDSGMIEGYGKELLQKWFRMKGVITSRFAPTSSFFLYSNTLQGYSIPNCKEP